jgi:ERO1-like protein beta
MPREEGVLQDHLRYFVQALPFALTIANPGYSGLHASISTHICNEYLDTVTGEYVSIFYTCNATVLTKSQKPDLACFINRVAAFPERLQYIYFDTVLLLRAVARIAPYLTSYDYCSTGTSDDSGTTAKLKEVTDIATRVGAFDETVLFRGENAAVLKEEFKTHFRNVSRIMDCVGCGKCQLWGKIQTTGLATAMKILFELDELALNPVTNPNLLQRSEVVALINTLHRMSESLYAVENFRRMWAETDEDASEKLIQGADRAVEHAARGKVGPVSLFSSTSS